MKGPKAGSFVIGISGGSGSGKTTLARELVNQLGPRAAILYQDWYYRDQSHRFDRDGGSVNFDHPDALEFELLAQHLAELRSGRSVKTPQYDFVTHQRRAEPLPFTCREVVVVDGILILHAELVRPHLDLAIFVKTPEELRFSRRLERDVAERGRTPEGVKAQFQNQVKPMHDQFVEPSQTHADHVVEGTGSFSSIIQQILRNLP